ncbi:MAG TPA: DUF6491 family protein [Sphingomicrobium sp.]|nr:DUF6491 family protein [Sphingomicrobium sp.]
MRTLSILLVGATLASCAAVPPQPMRTPERQAQYMRLLGDKVAGPPQSCLQSYNQQDLSIIDGRTLIYRQGTGRAYLVTLTPGCEQISTGGYALVTRSFGGMGMCQGDIAQVSDVLNRQLAGSCTVASIVPYARPGS